MSRRPYLVDPQASGEMGSANWGGILRIVLLVILLVAALAFAFRAIEREPAEPQTGIRVSQPQMLPVVAPTPDPVSNTERSVTSLTGLLRFEGPAVPLLRFVTTEPKRICAALDAHWAQNAWGAGGFECTSEVAPDAASGGSVFAIVRGAQSDRVGDIRLKLNLTGSAGDAAVRTAFAERLANLFGVLQWPLPTPLHDAVEAGESADLTILGTRIRFTREFGSLPRFNLAMRFPDIALRQPDASHLVPPKDGAPASPPEEGLVGGPASSG